MHRPFRNQRIYRFLALVLAVLLSLPHPALALREIQTKDSGLEEKEILEALREPVILLDRPSASFEDAIRRANSAAQTAGLEEHRPTNKGAAFGAGRETVSILKRMPGWLRQTVDPDRFLFSVYGVREAVVQQPAAVLFDPDLVPGSDDLSRQVLLIELTGQLKAAFAWPESVPFQLGLLSERAGLEEAGFRVIEVLRHPEGKRSPLPVSALPLVTAEALARSQPRFYVDPLFYAGLEELRLPEALANLADLFA